ncbi:hypothetical protein [Sinirhodobacter huangdaonensis]|uniref:Uncharacterized protein n=1 Tax=Paenirhodobacter huangdaonensis TaxID=2501515 RepID=A0A3S3PG35_9RHOB|nr:hypothetical protein [Sinirhodobacter huangdaonensis]RWR54032.1 hypothetical protein EOW66_05315 [Sinirhodobacter huangdaonensis]
MPTTAEDQIAELTAWLAASSRNDVSPCGDPIKRGPFAEIVGIGLDDPAPDLTAEIALGCLPLLTPADVPAPAFAEAQGQAVVMDRAAHVIWKAGAAKARPEGFPAVAVVGLEAGQTMRDACAAAGVDPDADRAVIGLPLYAILPGVALKLRPMLPVR